MAKSHARSTEYSAPLSLHVSSAAHELPIAPSRHDARCAHHPPDSLPQMIRPSFPAGFDRILPEKRLPDLPLAGARRTGIMDTQQLHAFTDRGIGRVKRRAKTPGPHKIEKPLQSPQSMRRCLCSPHIIMQQHRARSPSKAACQYVEPDMPMTVGQNRMFLALRPHGDTEPRREQRHVDAVARRDGTGFNRHGQRCRIEFGTPDDPRLRGPEVGTFSESAAPRRRNPPDRGLSGSLAHATRYSRDPAAATPTSGRHGRSGVAPHSLRDSANPRVQDQPRPRSPSAFVPGLRVRILPLIAYPCPLAALRRIYPKPEKGVI